MRKSTLFISVVLTTFMLAVLYGVVSAYQSIVNSNPVAAVQSQPSAVAEVANQPVASVPSTQVISTQITPQAAADIAGKVLGRTDMYSVEVAQYEGADVYLVTFSSGDIVYLSLDGQILSISKLAVTVINQPTGGGGGRGGNTGGTTNTGGEHDEHEGGDND